MGFHQIRGLGLLPAEGELQNWSDENSSNNLDQKHKAHELHNLVGRQKVRVKSYTFHGRKEKKNHVKVLKEDTDSPSGLSSLIRVSSSL